MTIKDNILIHIDPADILDGVVAVPAGVISLGEECLSWRDDITRIILPDGLVEIGIAAAVGDTNLRTVNLPNTLKIIYDNAFSRCSALDSVDLPSGVTVCEFAFCGCSALTHVGNIGKAAGIEKGAFALCQKIAIEPDDDIMTRLIKTLTAHEEDVIDALKDAQQQTDTDGTPYYVSIPPDGSIKTELSAPAGGSYLLGVTDPDSTAALHDYHYIFAGILSELLGAGEVDTWYI